MRSCNVDRGTLTDRWDRWGGGRRGGEGPFKAKGFLFWGGGGDAQVPCAGGQDDLSSQQSP